VKESFKLARQAKEPCNWVPTAPTIATVGTIGIVGTVGSEAEEAEETEEAEQIDSFLEARLDKAMAEPDREREEIFRNLKEFRRQKRRGQRLERQEQAREEMRVAMDQILQADAERSARESEGATRENTFGEAMAKTTDVGISYVEDENGKLVKKRTAVLRRTPLRKMPARRKTPADGIRDDIYVQDETGDVVRYVPPPRRFTQADRERVNKNRDRRHSRIWYAKQLLAVAEGRLILTKEQYHALIAFGRLKGWNRRQR